MSIDLFIAKWPTNARFRFPVAFGDEPTGSAAVPWPELRDYLLGIGAQPNLDEDHLWLDMADGQSLQFAGDRSEDEEGPYVAIRIEVHASGLSVLEVFKVALDFDARLVLGDDQEGLYHDAKSFEEFLKGQGGGAIEANDEEA